MIFKRIQPTSQNGNAGEVEKGSEEVRKRERDSKLVDVAHEAMREKAAEDRMTLESLIRMGWPLVRRKQEHERLKSKVRKKVWDRVRDTFGTTDDEMVEEVTEKIVETAEEDPNYKKMFDQEEA